MRNLLLLFIALIFSCSPETSSEEILNDCRCTKTTYEIIQETVTGTNGLPQLIFYENVLFSEVVNCQDEQSEVNNGDGTFFNIECE